MDEGLTAALLGEHEPVSSLYVHVPFCFHKCHYCDFYSIVDEHDRQEAFVRRLEAELRTLGPAARGPLRTIFVGGGTPSLLRPALWSVLLRVLRERFDLTPIDRREPGTEFTVECNPETVTPELAGVLLAGGVTRFSLGAQSFNPVHLKTLERWHDPASVGRALHTLLDAARAGRHAAPRLSLDLIFAIPGQTLDEWAGDLDAALAHPIGHLSCYNLTYEPNTAMTARLRRGEFEPIDEDLEAEMYGLTQERLVAAGLERYEVSNSARSGALGGPSEHNLVYWRNESWLAAGPGASGHLRVPGGGWRWKNAANLRAYLDSGDGFAPRIEIETPDPGRAVRERIMMGVRISEGLDERALLEAAEHAHAGAGDRLRTLARRAADDGFLHLESGRWRLTGAGFLCADHVAAELMRAID
ncbi:MAG: radical SAM family heme chaperone HemW [Phycisphaerales bacterium]